MKMDGLNGGNSCLFKIECTRHRKIGTPKCEFNEHRARAYVMRCDIITADLYSLTAFKFRAIHNEHVLVEKWLLE